MKHITAKPGPALPAPLYLWCLGKALYRVSKHQLRLFWLFHIQPKQKQA